MLSWTFRDKLNFHLQIEDFVKQNKVDILHIQEIEICEESFCDCNFLSESFNILSNNSENGYGTASLIRADLEYTNVKFDTAGRAIVFDIGEISFGNFYAHSGTDANLFHRSSCPNIYSPSARAAGLLAAQGYARAYRLACASSGD